MIFSPLIKEFVSNPRKNAGYLFIYKNCMLWYNKNASQQRNL